MNTKAKAIQVNILIPKIHRTNANFFWRFRGKSKQDIAILNNILFFLAANSYILV